MIGLHGQGRERRVHGFVRRAQNVDRIDLDVIDHARRPDHLRVARKIEIYFLAHFGHELLRVVQFPVSEFFGKNDRRRYNRSRERAAARFINTDDMRHASGSQFLFITKPAAPIHQCKSFSICTE
jgi:hypothetical protein